MERRLRIYFLLTIFVPIIFVHYTNGILTSEPKYIDQYLKPIWDYRNKIMVNQTKLASDIESGAILKHADKQKIQNHEQEL
jgi:hypothetical protein